MKVHHGPGGQSNFSLAWDAEPQHSVKAKQTQEVSQKVCQPLQPQNQANNVNDPVTSTTGKSSVKIQNPPGGRSNIQFG